MIGRPILLRLTPLALLLPVVLAAIVWAQPAPSPSDGPGVEIRPSGIEEQGQPSRPIGQTAGPDADLLFNPDSTGSVNGGTPRPLPRTSARQTLIASLTIFVLAVFVGFEVIVKVPPTFHTPLMSGSNAISGITLVGAIIVAGYGYYFSTFIGFLAVILGTVNVVGGFLVTHRMLSMFKRR